MSPRQANLTQLRRAIDRTEAQAKEIKAAVILVNVRVLPPDARDKVDAVELRMDHAAEEPVSIYVPYVVAKGKVVEFAEPFTLPGQRFAFGSE